MCRVECNPSYYIPPNVKVLPLTLDAFSLSSTFLNLVFFLLTLCIPLEQPNLHIIDSAYRIYGRNITKLDSGTKKNQTLADDRRQTPTLRKFLAIISVDVGLYPTLL